MHAELEFKLYFFIFISMENHTVSSDIEIITQVMEGIPEFTHKTSTEEIQHRIEGKDHDFIFAEDEGNPVGFLIAYALDEKTYYNWIMGVLPDYRDKGYGRQLIELFELHAKQKGYDIVQVKTMEKFPAMRHLLSAMKYKEIGHDEDGKIILRKNL